LVICGNPPYSGHSANQNEWTDKLLKGNFVSFILFYLIKWGLQYAVDL